LDKALNVIGCANCDLVMGDRVWRSEGEVSERESVYCIRKRAYMREIM